MNARQARPGTGTFTTTDAGTRAGAFTFAIAALVVACTPKSKVQTEMLVAAVEKVRLAEGEAKAQAATVLESVPCTAQPICDAKKDCVRYANKNLEGLKLKGEVEKALADIQAGKVSKEASDPGSLYGKLDDASRALKEAETALMRCDEQLLRLKFQNGL